jgi:ABC-type sugar transport system permease subunit
MAGLATIPRELYESAQVDGASWSARFWHITMPGIKNVSMVVVVLHLIWTFTNFDVIYLLTGGGPLHATEVLPTFLYQQAFELFDMGYASAIGLFILIFLVVTVGPLYFRANAKT